MKVAALLYTKCGNTVPYVYFPHHFLFITMYFDGCPCKSLLCEVECVLLHFFKLCLRSHLSGGTRVYFKDFLDSTTLPSPPHPPAPSLTCTPSSPIPSIPFLSLLLEVGPLKSS